LQFALGVLGDYPSTMSHQSLFGAFPISTEGGGLAPEPDVAVGELRGSSRNGAFFRGLGELLDTLPAHEALRFLAADGTALGSPAPDGTHWTVLDSDSTPPIITALDDLLRACHAAAADVAEAHFFRDAGLTAAQVRHQLAAARECSDVNAEMPSDDGDDVGFLFTVLVSLRGFLRRAHGRSRRVALFTWSARG
jgi:hypothetical protein